MAEIFGAVASGAGLVSLSMQLLESARKLKGFCDSSRDAPETIVQLYWDLETVSLTLLQLEQCRQTDNLDNEPLSRCIVTCDQAVMKIKVAVDKMNSLLHKSRFMGKLYIAFKEPEMNSLLEVLEHAKNSMLMAYTIYCQHWHMRQATQHAAAFNLQNQRIESLRKLVESGNTVLMRQIATSTVKKAESSPFPKHVGAQTTGRPLHVHNRRSQTFKYRVALPCWFTAQVWELMAYRSNQVWTIQVWPVYIRARGTLAFDPVFNGDVETVRNLLMQGELSIHDHTDNWLGPEILLEARVPVTTMHTWFAKFEQMAATGGHINLCKFLLETAPVLRDTPILHSALLQIYHHAYRSPKYPELRLMDEAYNLFVGTHGLEIGLKEIDSPSLTPSLQRHAVLYRTKASINAIMANQNIPLAGLAPKQRFGALLLHKAPAETAKTSTDSGKTALHWAAAHFGEWWNGRRTKRFRASSGLDLLHEARRYKKLASDLVVMGADVHALWDRPWRELAKPYMTKTTGISPFISFLAGIFNYRTRWNRLKLSNAVRQWGEMLTRGGCALRSYINTENRYLSSVRLELDFIGWHLEIVKLVLSNNSHLAIEVNEIAYVHVFKAQPSVVPGAWPSSWPRYIPDTINWHPREIDERDGFQWVDVSKAYIKPRRHRVARSSITSDVEVFSKMQTLLLNASKDNHDIHVLGWRARTRTKRDLKFQRRARSVPLLADPVGYWDGCGDECAEWRLHKRVFASESSLRRFLENEDYTDVCSPFYETGWEAWLVGSEKHLAVAKRFAQRFSPALIKVVEETARRAADRARLAMGPQWNGDTDAYLREGYRSVIKIPYPYPG